MDERYKIYRKYYLMRMILTALGGGLLGGLLLLAEPYAMEVFDVLLIAVGLMTAVLNLPAFCQSLVRIRAKGEWISLVISLVAILSGVLLMLVRRDGILLFLGVYSVVFPIVRMALVQEHKKRLKREIPMILFGVCMVLVSLAQVEESVFFIGGILILALTALYLLWSLVMLRFRLSAIAAYLREQAESTPTDTDN